MTYKPKEKPKYKAKFDKNKCYRCKYHSEGTWGHQVNVKQKDGSVLIARVSCDYLAVTGESCLYEVKDKEGEVKVKDRRGSDYHNCKLFQDGKHKCKHRFND